MHTASIFLGALVALMLRLAIFAIMVQTQDVNVILLTLSLTFVLMIINDLDIMWDFVNGRRHNVIAGLTTAALIVLSLLLVVTSRFG